MRIYLCIITCADILIYFYITTVLCSVLILAGRGMPTSGHTPRLDGVCQDSLSTALPIYFLTENLSAYNQLCVIWIENLFLPLDSKLHKDKIHVAAHRCNPSVTAQHLKCSMCSESVDQMTEQRQTD